jgi:hypothetical protein
MVSGLFSANTAVHFSTAAVTDSWGHAIAVAETPVPNRSTKPLIALRNTILSSLILFDVRPQEARQSALLSSTFKRGIGRRLPSSRGLRGELDVLWELVGRSWHLPPLTRSDLVILRLLGQEAAAFLDAAECSQHRPAAVVLNIDHELYPAPSVLT